MGIQINQREKRGLILAGIALVLFGLWQWGIAPFLERLDQRTRQVAAKEKTVAEMAMLKREYQQLKQQSDQLKTKVAQRDPDFSLYAFLDRLSGRAGLKNNIDYMKPSRRVESDGGLNVSAVELKFLAITLEQLTDYLKLVEHSDLLISIQRAALVPSGKTDGLLDATLMVETYETS